MKKVGIIVAVILAILLLGVQVVDSDTIEMPDTSQLQLVVNGKVYENADGQSQEQVVTLTLQGGAELQFENVTTHIKKQSNGYQLHYKGQLKGVGKRTIQRGIRFFGLSFVETIVEKRYIYDVILGSLDFTQSFLINQDEKQPQWVIEQTIPIKIEQ